MFKQVLALVLMAVVFATVIVFFKAVFGGGPTNWVAFAILAVAFLLLFRRVGGFFPTRRQKEVGRLDKTIDAVKTRHLPLLPEPVSDDERQMFGEIRDFAGPEPLEPITYNQLVKELWQGWQVRRSFPVPETPVLIARGIAWGVLKPSEADIREALDLARKYDDALLLSFPMETLDANLKKLAVGRGAT